MLKHLVILENFKDDIQQKLRLIDKIKILEIIMNHFNAILFRLN